VGQVKKIMIVDDSRVSRMMIKSIVVDKNPHWEVLEAGNTDEALKLSINQVIDYFSVDLNMPGRDGLELIELLKPEFKSSKFALLTANIQQATHERAEKLIVQCFNKPVTNESINQMLRYFNE
jgi:CheY-like chemotaxis protein